MAALVIIVMGLTGCAGDGGAVDANGGGGGAGGDFDLLQAQILTPKCALAGCHDAASRQGDLSLANAQTSFAELLNVISTCAGRLRVVADDTANSYFLDKLGAGSAPCGLVMPLGLPALSQDEINMIVTWINAGAPPPVGARRTGAPNGAGSTSTSTTTSTTLR